MKIESRTVSIDDAYHFIKAMNNMRRVRDFPDPDLVKISLENRHVALKSGEEVIDISDELDALNDAYFVVFLGAAMTNGTSLIQKFTWILQNYNALPTELFEKKKQEAEGRIRESILALREA